jgi:soluble lytic murein transglycosylase
MSTSTAPRRTRTRPAPAPSRRPPRRRGLRRRLGLLAAVAFAGAIVAASLAPWADKAVKEVSLPLRHEDIIRQQAADKDLDPALIAAVIYEESRFRDQTSHAGARGLMQITPETADAIAKHSGGTRFQQEDLADPQINIAYGSYYLRLLIDHYGGNETLAIAAYNAGMGNVDRWVSEAGGADEFDHAEDIPFPETRAYVSNVMESRAEYRENYADDLGL